MQNFKELSVWQKSMELVKEVYGVIQLLPKEEMFALSNQIRRSAVSIPSNIAEGHDRNSDKAFIQFLNIAKGSNAELETQLLIAVSLGYVTSEKTEKALLLCEETSKMIKSLLRSMEKRYEQRSQSAEL